jgi:ribosomal protein S27E
MKIIKQGIAPESVPLHGRCNHCRTEIEFLPMEAKYNSDQRDGDFYSIECPTCRRTITAAVRGYNGPG